jgi:hypothetical protein
MPAYSQVYHSASDRGRRATLVIAHPGHELRVHGWLETARPNVWVLTDGSGHTQHSRIDSSTRVLEAAGATPGPIYGQMRDVDLYNAVLSFDYRRFTDLVDQLATVLIRDDVDFIAGDAEEGYNPAHDICRSVINAAVRLVERKTKKQIANYDFTLVSAPSRCPEEVLADSLWLNLDEPAFARKLAAARNYPELQAEVDSALNGAGNETFRQHSDLVERAHSTFGATHAHNFWVEWLRPVDAHIASLISSNGDAPFYEAYGDKQVIAGHYANVLRYREHMLPLAAALNSHVERSS